MPMLSGNHTLPRPRAAVPVVAALAAAVLFATAAPAGAAPTTTAPTTTAPTTTAPTTTAPTTTAPTTTASSGTAPSGTAPTRTAPASTGAAHAAPGKPAPAPSFTQQALYAKAEDGYSCFRIPAIVKSTRGTLLAFAEGRVDNCGDAGDIDAVLKRSTDGGKTWSPLAVVNSGGGDTHGNPTPVVDARTGRILLVTTYNKGRTDSAGCATPCDRTVHLQYSDDDGLTWSAPGDITAQARASGWDSWYASGPGHAVQLSQGPHKGRLVFGINAESSDGLGHPVANHAALVYSDDDGDTWHIGAVDTIDFPAGGTFTQKPQELSLTELPVAPSTRPPGNRAARTSATGRTRSAATAAARSPRRSPPSPTS